MKCKISASLFVCLTIIFSFCSVKTTSKQVELLWNNVDTDAILFADNVAKSYNLPTEYKITNKIQKNDTCSIYLTPTNCFDCQESSLKIIVDLKNKKVIYSGFMNNH